MKTRGFEVRFSFKVSLTCLVYFCLKQDWKICFLDLSFQHTRFLIDFNLIFCVVLRKSCSLTFSMCGYSDIPEILVKDYCFFNDLPWQCCRSIDRICWFIPGFCCIYILMPIIKYLDYCSFISLNLSAEYLSSQNVSGCRILGGFIIFSLWLLSFHF